MSKASITTAQPIWDFLSGNSQPRRTAAELYGRLVAHSRAPAIYADLNVPDTPEGRFEVLMLHVVLMLRRLSRDGAVAEPLSRAVSEAFVTDMDDCLREMGVGDLTVAKKVKLAAAALYDRSRDYGAALASNDADGLARLLRRHVWAESGTPDAGVDTAARRLAAYAAKIEAQLADHAIDAVAEGRLDFPVVPA